MTDHTLGLLQGTFNVAVMWMIVDLADPVWWLTIIIAFSVGVLSGVVGRLGQAWHADHATPRPIKS